MRTLLNDFFKNKDFLYITFVSTFLYIIKKRHIIWKKITILFKQRISVIL